jgi:transcriptional regulator of acetoin/glycerol metabolism
MAVVTLSCDLTPRSDLLKPLVRSMTTQLEQHLMSVEHPDAREMLGAFVSLTRQQPGPVVAFGPQGIMIQSSTASSMSDHDKSLLQGLASEGRPSGRYALELSSGLTDLTVTRIGRNNSVVSVARDSDSRSSSTAFSLPRVVGRSPEWLSIANQVDRLRDSRELVILVGEAGVGKTTLALGTPFKSGLTAPNSTLVDAAQRHILGTRDWLRRLSEALNSRHNVVIRGIETLDAPALDGARSLFDSRTTSGAVFLTLTADRPEDLEPHLLRFTAQAIAVPSLRDRITDLEELWAALANATAPTARLELSAEAAELLRVYDWPGNVKELRQVINQLATSGRTGKIVPGDLPTTMQNRKTLSLIERVELEAIRKALLVADGNRVKAADILGISRATVYRKMKAYRLGGE